MDQASTLAAFSRARSRPTCQSNRRTKIELFLKPQDRQGARSHGADSLLARADEVIE